MLQKQKERRKKRTHVTQNSLASSLHYAEVLFNHVILTSVLELQTIITQTNQAEGLPSPLHQQWSTTVLCSYIYVWSLTVSVAQSSCCCYCCHETSCSASLHRPLTQQHITLDWLQPQFFKVILDEMTNRSCEMLNRSCGLQMCNYWGFWAVNHPCSFSQSEYCK